MIVEIIKNLEDLKPGDIIIYSTNARLKTARIEKTPRKKPNSEWYATTRASVCVKTYEIAIKKWVNNAYVDVPYTYHVQKFTLENDKFNKIKYLNLYKDKEIIRLVQL